MMAGMQVSVPARSDEHATLAASRGELWTMMRIGGFDEALVRSLVYVLDCETQCDEQAMRVLRRLPGCRPGLDASRLARMVHEQAAVLRLDRAIAVESLPALLPDDKDGAAQLLESIASVLGADARDRVVSQRFGQVARVVSFA